MVRSGLLLVAWALALPVTGHTQEIKQKYERDLITRQEINERALDSQNALEIVQRLRPHFLRERSAGSIPSPLGSNGSRNSAAAKVHVQVYVNGALQGATPALREVLRDAIIDILYLNSSDATIRFGTGHENGAILVRTGVQ